MNDTEILDFIESNRLAVTPVLGGGYCIEKTEPTGGDDYMIVELSREPKLRKAAEVAAKNERL